MELRDHAGLAPHAAPKDEILHPILALAATSPILSDAPSPLETTPGPEEPVATSLHAAPPDVAPTEAETPPSENAPSVVAAPAPDTRVADVARNGLAVFDKLAVGLLVSRDNIPILANRHLLDLLGFADEDALHDAGGMAHLFGNQPGNVSGSEAVGLRAADGTIIPSNARMQRIEWDGLPATLLTLAGARVTATRTEPMPPAPVAAEPIPLPVEKPPRQDQSLREARELRAILETATDGVAVFDAEGNVLSLNRSGEALFGCDRTQVIGKPFLDLFRRAQPEPRRRLFRRFEVERDEEPAQRRARAGSSRRTRAGRFRCS